MKAILQFIRTTLVGGVLFLLPILLIAYIIKQSFGMVMKLVKPIASSLPDSIFGGFTTETAVTIFALLIVAFLFGLFARTSLGQKLFGWLESSFVGSLPQFNFARGLSDSVGGTDNHSIEVVLVPADAGWAIGLIFERTGDDWVSVFIPGAPQWSSGSVVFAEAASVRPLDISFMQVMQIQRKLGVGSDAVLKCLAAR